MTLEPNQKPPFTVVAIDGGAASGKSSTSTLLAGRLNLLHVDTGSHYRAVTFACLREGLEPKPSPELDAFLQGLRFHSLVEGNASRVSLDGVTPMSPQQLRSTEVNAAVSPFSALPQVRHAVKAYQRSQVEVARQAGFSGLVMEGRDIGTVILPEADLKVFLQADTATRQRRREKEGATDAIRDRDHRDASRATAPLRAADDAVRIDNSTIGLDAVVERIVQLVREVQNHNA